jgi:hypothetical protein
LSWQFQYIIADVITRVSGFGLGTEFYVVTGKLVKNSDM